MRAIRQIYTRTDCHVTEDKTGLGSNSNFQSL
jgi:hypothetical protein